MPNYIPGYVNQWMEDAPPTQRPESTGWAQDEEGQYSFINPFTNQIERSFTEPQIISPQQDPRRQMQQQMPEISGADRAFEEMKGEDWGAIQSQYDRNYRELTDKWASEDNELARQAKNDPDNAQYYKNLMKGLKKKYDDVIAMEQGKLNEKIATFQMNWAGNKRQFDLFNELAGKGELSSEEIEEAKFKSIGLTYPAAVEAEKSIQQQSEEAARKKVETDIAVEQFEQQAIAAGTATKKTFGAVSREPAFSFRDIPALVNFLNRYRVAAGEGWDFFDTNVGNLIKGFKRAIKEMGGIEALSPTNLEQLIAQWENLMTQEDEWGKEKNEETIAKLYNDLRNKAGGGKGTKEAPMIVRSPTTGERKFSIDGGKTWQPLP